VLMFVFVILWPIIGPSLHAYAYEGGATSDPSGRVGIPPTLPPVVELIDSMNQFYSVNRNRPLCNLSTF
jgi:hypothetical protein